MAREHSQFLGSWSPDGSELVFGEEHPETGRDMWLFNLADPTVPTPLLTTAANENQAAFSPDGRWLAYTSDETGRDEVYVMAMPSTGRRQAITGDGGSEPQWSPDGRQLYFRRGSTLLTVDLREEGGELTPESPRTLPVSATWHNTWVPGLRRRQRRSSARDLRCRVRRSPGRGELVRRAFSHPLPGLLVLRPGGRARSRSLLGSSRWNRPSAHSPDPAPRAARRRERSQALGPWHSRGSDYGL